MTEPDDKKDGDARRSATVDRGVGHLVIINGGAAVALMAFLQALWVKDPNLAALVLLPLFIFALGTGTAGAINLLRYEASLTSQHYKATQEQDENLKREQLWWSKWSKRCQWSAVMFFVLGVFTVTAGAALTLAKTPFLFAFFAEVLILVAGAAISCLVLALIARDKT